MAYRQLGDYEVLANLETPEFSLRVLKITKESVIQPHHHHRTTQTYFVLEGTAKATVDDHTTELNRYQVLRVPVDAVHSLQTDSQAIVLSISVPPLEPSDQHVAAQR